jgi:DNA-binding winged helix-turn-helix (wHTH) protein/cytochrome c-type biogenesis protein CcmH/NrfG
MPSAAIVYRFGPFRLDAAGGRLFRDDVVVELSPRLVDLLGLFAARPGELLTKDALLAALWPDVFVTENAVTRAISDLRQALDDDPAAPLYIQTVTRRGYRFIAAVDVRPREHALTRAGSDSSSDARAGAGIDVGSAASPTAAAGGYTARAARALDTGGNAGTEAGADEQTDALLPYRAWREGRLQLETLDVTALTGAVASFERAVMLAPRDALARAGLASARFMQHETTRARNAPDRDALRQAVADARAACALDPSAGEAWATLGLILVSTGDLVEASAAARRATTLQPGNWRHEFRLAYATWGEERLRAVDRALALFPDFAFAHFLGAMVHVARRAFPAADAMLARGAAIQDRQAGRRATLPAAGLHWLRGLTCLAQPGREQALAALAHFERERAFESSGELYAVEFTVNAWHATGCAHLALGDTDAALLAFREALHRLPGHARSHLGESIALQRAGRPSEAETARAAARVAIDELHRGGRAGEATLVAAAEIATRAEVADVGGDDRRAAGAIAMLERLLTEAGPGFVGWSIPIDPLLAPLRGLAAFDRVLTIVAERAA